MEQREGVSHTLYEFAQSFEKVDRLLDTAISELDGRTALRSEGTIPYKEARETLIDMHIDIAGRDENIQGTYDTLIKPLDKKMTMARRIYNSLRAETNRANIMIPRDIPSFSYQQSGGTA